MENVTSTDKIDPKLRAEIKRLEEAGRTDGRLSVIVEHTATVVAPADAQGAAGMSALDARVEEVQQGLRNRLTTLGIQGVRRVPLTNALAADLTPAQIREIAADAEVKRLLWNVAEKVTPLSSL